MYYGIIDWIRQGYELFDIDSKVTILFSSHTKGP